MSKPKFDIEGRRIKVVTCNDPYTKVKPGTYGTVAFVDDVNTVHVEFDDGTKLGLCHDDGDRWELVTQLQATRSCGFDVIATFDLPDGTRDMELRTVEWDRDPAKAAAALRAAAEFIEEQARLGRDIYVEVDDRTVD